MWCCTLKLLRMKRFGEVKYIVIFVNIFCTCFSVQKWHTLSPFGMSLYDTFKDNTDVQDLMQSDLLSFSEK